MPFVSQAHEKTKLTAGHQPILTRGLGTRGQVDLIDFQAYPDGAFKHLLVYVDHGIKICWLTPIVAKRASTVVFALFQNFCFMGPSVILQTDNGREFSGPANSKIDLLEDNSIDEVIGEIKNYGKIAEWFVGRQDILHPTGEWRG